MTQARPAEQDGFPFGLVIFDCDGVLVDSEILSARVLSGLLAGLGYAITSDLFFERYLGRAFSAVEADYRAETGRSLPPGFAAEVQAALQVAFRAELQPIPGIREVLVSLQRRGCPFALASSSSLPRIAHSLEVTGLAPFFAGRTFSSSMVNRGKPAPDLFLHVAEALSLPPASALVIEDSPAGVLAGKAAGMTVWGFVGGGHHQQFSGSEGLRQAGADRIVTTMAEIDARLA